MRLGEATASVAAVADIVQDTRPVILARVIELDELREVTSHREGSPVVALIPNERRAAVRALQNGAAAVLALDANEAEIGAAVAGVMNGLLVVPSGTAGLSDSHSELALAPEPLTPREVEILQLLAGGDSNKTIAARLSISVHTVKFNISSVLAKLGVSSRTEAVALALKLGMVLL